MLAKDVLTRLVAEGAVVTGPVGTVADAIDLAGDIDLDAALLDVSLDGELVYPVAEILISKNIPFAFVSGKASRIFL